MSEILFVSDDADFCDTIAEVLVFEGYKVKQVKADKTIFESLERNSPNLIICDVSLPWLKGLEVLKHTRMKVMFKDVPILILSGHFNLSEECDIGILVPKPFLMDDLLSIVAESLVAS